jgi:hypothetical protein
MNSPKKIFLLCPVPEDQKPINEYLQLKSNFFEKKEIFSFKTYKQKIIFVFLIFFSFLTFLEITELKNKGLNLLIDNFLISTFCIFFIVFVNLLRWIEVNKKFLNSRLFYEEGSWYDGETWEKPFLLIKNDKLISVQNIQPIIQKFSFLFFILIFFFFISFLFKIYIY